MQRKNFLYSGDGSSNSDEVHILDSMRELLQSLGNAGTWETLTDIINNVKKYTNTSSEIYEEFKPKELLEPGINFDTEFNEFKITIMNTLNDIVEYITKFEEINNGDVPTGGGGGGGYYSGNPTTSTGNTDTSQDIDGLPVDNAPIPIVTTTEDTDTSSEIDIDQGITSSPEVNTTTPSSGEELGNLFVENNGTIDIFDANGKKIDTYGKGKYSIYEYKYDENGNPIAARISPDGEDEKWVNLQNISEDVYTVQKGQKGNYSLGDNNFPVYDKDGQQIGTVNANNYTVYETKYDGNGNPIAVRISPDGEDEKWLQLKPGQTNGYYYEIGQKGNYFLKDGTLSIYDDNGNIVGTATAGNFTVYGTKIDNKGTVIAVKISKPGENEQWIYINPNNTNGFYYGLGQKGTYSLTGGQTLKIYDNKGNVIGTLSDGNHTVYGVTYDTAGNIISIRISPNGKEEQIVYTTDENGKVIGEFKSIENMMKMDDGKVIVTTSKKKSNSLKYLGILGGLSVALGTTLIVKKKINEKNKDTNEYESEEYTEEPLEPGDYNVYEFKKDENNNITDARISNDNEKDELWVHF